MADKAREKALKKMAAKPPVDPEVEAKRREARLAREAAAAEKSAARREAMEEAGLELGRLEPVAEVYASPGSATDFFHIFVGLADLPDAATGVSGLDAEHEDIRSHLLDFDALMALCDRQEAANGPLVIAAYWLARHRARLRSAGGNATSG